MTQKMVRANVTIWDSAAEVYRAVGEEFPLDVDVVSPKLFDFGYVELVTPMSRKEKEAKEKAEAEKLAALEAEIKKGQTQGP